MTITKENYNDVENYVNKMWKHYKEQNSEKHAEFTALQSRKKELLDMHLQHTEERRARYSPQVLDIFDAFVDNYTSSKQFEKIQDLVNGNLNSFDVPIGKNGRALSRTSGQIATIAKTETDLNKQIDIASEYMGQLKQKLEMVQKTLIPHLERVSVEAFLNGQNEKASLVEKAREFIGVSDTIIYGGGQSEHQKVNGIVSYCLGLIKMVNNGMVDEKFRNNMDELFPLIADKISNLMITLIGSVGEICADFLLTYLRAVVKKKTGEDLSKLGLNHGIVGQARYTGSGGLISLNAVSQVSPHSDSLKDFQEAVQDVKEAESGINTSKADVVATLTLDQCTVFLPLSVKQVTIKKGQTGKVRVHFQSVSFEEGFIRLYNKLNLNRQAYRKFIHNVIASSIGLNEKKKEADSIRNMVGTASLLTAIVGLNPVGTQNILGVMINGRIFHLRDFLQKVIDNEFGPSYQMRPSLRSSYIKNSSVNAKNFDNNIYKAARERSKEVNKRAEDYLSSVKIDIGVRIAAQYLQ